MTQLPDFKAVIFDMDGLILDTESTYFSAWQHATGVLGYQLSDVFCASLSGLAFSDVAGKLSQYLGGAFPFSEFYRLSEDFWRTAVERDGIAVKKGAHDVLAALQARQIPYCLATNSAELNARECLQYAGMADLFTHLVCGDHVSMPKPAADLFLQAASILGQPITACLVVEDSLTGLLAAKNARAFSILIASTDDVDGQMQALADIRLSDLLELSVLVNGK